MFLRQEAFMLALQVDSPGDRKIKCSPALEKNVHGFRIGTAHERRILHVLQALPQPLVHKPVQEFDLFRAVLQGVTDQLPDKCLRHVHVPAQVAKSHFRLYHPELRRMARGVGIFRPERGAERVNIAQGAGKSLPFQLAAHGQIGRLSKEIPRGVAGGGITHVQRRHAEHFPRPFAIAGGDDGRTDPDKVPGLEKPVDGRSQTESGAAPTSSREEARKSQRCFPCPATRAPRTLTAAPVVISAIRS